GGIGSDLHERAPQGRALERRQGRADRLFTEAELARVGARFRPARHLAARFAAKEAAIKALGVALPVREIEVEGGDREPPRFRLHGHAAELAKQRGLELEVSL